MEQQLRKISAVLLCRLSAGAVVFDGVAGMSQTANDLLTATIEISKRFVPSFNNCFRSISTGMNTTLDANAGNCADAYSTAAISTNIASLYSVLQYASVHSTSIYNCGISMLLYTGTYVKTNQTAAQTSVASIQSTIASIKVTTDLWSAGTTITYASGTYSISGATISDATTAVASVTTCQNNLTSASDGQSSVQTISTLGATLASTAFEENNIATNMASLTKTQSQYAGRYLKYGLTSSVGLVQKSVSETLNELTNTITSSCTNGRATIDSFTTQVKGFNLYRNIGMVCHNMAYRRLYCQHF